jgi:hypothetical protein
MIFDMTVEEALVRVERSCGLAAAASENTDLTAVARDGLVELLEDAVILLDELRHGLDASVLNLTFNRAA